MFVRQEDRRRVAARFGYDAKLPAVQGVIDREEPLAVPQGVLVLGPAVGTDIHPIAFHVAIEKRPRIFLGFEKHKERLGVMIIQPTVNRGEVMYTALLLSLIGFEETGFRVGAGTKTEKAAQSAAWKEIANCCLAGLPRALCRAGV